MKAVRTAAIVTINTLVVILLADVVLALWNARRTEEDAQREAAPYIAFRGSPNALDHDRWGYRWVPESVSRDAFKIAFFGGSTGYHGGPPIAIMLQDLLAKRLGRAVSVANFSVVSSNHRMHLHNIVESRSIFQPDLIIFYGGYNETLGAADYDPRPGYPMNFFYVAETSALSKVLYEHSYIARTLEAITVGPGNYFTPLLKLQDAYKPLSADWNDAVIENYFDTLSLAKTIGEAFTSSQCGQVRFTAFFQPFLVPNQFEKAYREVRARLVDHPFVTDVSQAYNDLGPDVWADTVHVEQIANERMAHVMADVIGQRELLRSCEINSRS
jgi:hypothetical protein